MFAACLSVLPSCSALASGISSHCTTSPPWLHNTLDCLLDYSILPCGLAELSITSHASRTRQKIAIPTLAKHARQQVKTEEEDQSICTAATIHKAQGEEEYEDMTGEYLDEEQYNMHRSQPDRRDSVVDEVDSSSAGPQDISLYPSAPHVSAPNSDDLWRRAKSHPCRNCTRKQVPGRSTEHAFADCPWIHPMLRRMINVRLRQAGYESDGGEEGTKQDNREILYNSIQIPCLRCIRNGSKTANTHTLFDCPDVDDERSRKCLQRFRTGFAVVDDVLGGKDGLCSVRPERELCSTPSQSVTSAPVLETNWQWENWKSLVLEELLQMEMTARPSSWLEVAHAVRRELQARLMEDVMRGDPAQGIPISIPLLEQLLPRIEALEYARLHVRG